MTRSGGPLSWTVRSVACWCTVNPGLMASYPSLPPVWRTGDPPYTWPFGRLRTLAGCGKTLSTIPLTPFLPSCQEGGKNLYLRDTLRLPALRQAQDRLRGFAPLHSPFFSSLLGVEQDIGLVGEHEIRSSPLIGIVNVPVLVAAGLPETHTPVTAAYQVHDCLARV